MPQSRLLNYCFANQFHTICMIMAEHSLRYTIFLCHNSNLRTSVSILVHLLQHRFSLSVKRDVPDLARSPHLA